MSFFGSSRYSSGGGGYGGYGGYGGGYDYAGHDEEDYEDITFVRPDGDTEGKSISWCKSNGFFEIEEGVWSGPWYYRQNPEEHPDKKFPHKCPVGGCHAKFKTEAELDKHLRMGTGKPHHKYRTSRNIQHGPTQEEKKVAAQEAQEAKARRLDDEYADLLDELYGDCGLSPREEERIRKRLDEISAQRDGGAASKKQSRGAKRMEHEPKKKKAKKSSPQVSRNVLEPAAKRAKKTSSEKKDPFATLMKSGGVAKKTPKGKKSTAVTVTPPNKQEGPPVVECVYARYAKTKDSHTDDLSVVGFEFKYSDGFTKKFGRTVGTKKSDPMHLVDKEYIVSIDVENSYYCDGMSSVTFYTSSSEGRSVCFGVGINSYGEDPSEDFGHQFHRAGFRAKNGTMITEVKISEGEITSVKKEKVPKSGNRDWEDNWR
eukprot:CAMPEP_0181031938 /NCGR_PEP_ID=MMETSP1070-20121207/6488_1 /TAXON_ID=265543 /ORGANISM="Minutocellus polymorphus, Strain NH13" /LENGTH=427 /DNA_ID=CAMNT_0023109327 /DNA_START=1 /DNA_END=1284 /DNA_ORIENTATION=-